MCVCVYMYYLYDHLYAMFLFNCVSCPCVCKDPDQWEKLGNVIGDSCSLLSDITYKPQAPPLPGVRGHILKHMNETTVSDLIRITSDQQGDISTMVV